MQQCKNWAKEAKINAEIENILLNISSLIQNRGAKITFKFN